MVRSTTSTPASRSSVITRCRVMPLRNVPFGIGVCTTPPLTIMMFCAVNSATLPIGSRITALSNPRRFASAAAIAASGYRHAAFACVGAWSGPGRRYGRQAGR